MAGGFFTKSAIALAIVTLVLVSFLSIIIDSAEKYNAVVDTSANSMRTTATGQNQELARIIQESQQRQDNAGIDQGKTDIAQVQSLIDAEKSKVNLASMFTTLLAFLQQTLGFTPLVTTTIISIITIMTTAGVYYLWRQQNP
jgi:uncharacterized protein YqgV (UPF0045/DUF77 family)